MATKNYVNDGTASVTAETKTVTFADVSLALMKSGDQFMQKGASGIIDTLDLDAGTAQLVDDWGGTTTSAQPYTVMTIPVGAELANSTRTIMQYLNGPILSIAQMAGDDAPAAGDTLVWDDITGGWLNSTPEEMLDALLSGRSTGTGDVVLASAPTIAGATLSGTVSGPSGSWASTGLTSLATLGVGGAVTPGYLVDCRAASDVKVLLENTGTTGEAGIRCSNTANSAFFGCDPTGSYVGSSGAAPLRLFGNAAERVRIGSVGMVVNQTTDGGWTGAASLEGKTTSGTGISGWATGNAVAVRARADNTPTGVLVAMASGTTAVGSITTNGSTVTYGGTSSGFLKMNRQKLTADDLFARLEVWEGDWIYAPGKRWRGVIASDLYRLRPDAVVLSTTPELAPHQEGYVPDMVDYGFLMPDVLAEILAMRQRMDAAGI